MDSPVSDALGFAPDHDQPIPYMQRTRDYYIAIGYTTPYRWAHHNEAPFARLAKKLSQARVAIVTTAAPYQPDKGDQGPGAAYNGSAEFYQVYDGDTAADHDLRISHIGYDRRHTTATDPGTWFPLPALRRAAAAGRIGAVAPRFFGAPTNRSHRVTLETDAPEIVRRALADGVDAAVLVPDGNHVFVGGERIADFRPNAPGHNVIQAAAPDGVAGRLDVTRPELNLSGSLAALIAQPVDFGLLRPDICDVGTDSSFTVLGRGALPAPASAPLRSR